MSTLQLTREVLEKFHWWREFLKRSEKYSRINTLLKNRSATHPPSDPLICSWCYALPELRKPYYDWMWSAVTYEERYALTQEDPAYANILDYTYPLFQDVDDEEQAHLFEHRVKLFYELFSFVPVGGAQENIKDHVRNIACNYEESEAPTALDFLDEIEWGIDIRYSEGKMSNIIAFDQSLPDELIVNQFRVYLKSIKKRGEQIPSSSRPLFFSSNGHRISLFEDYIILLDRIGEKGPLFDIQAQEHALEEIFKEDNPELILDRSNCSIWKKLQRHRKKSFQLIHKAENGQFPGPYTATKNQKIIKSDEYSKVESLIQMKRQQKRNNFPARRFPLDNYFTSRDKKSDPKHNP